jgi:hypothetical protein
MNAKTLLTRTTATLATLLAAGGVATTATGAASASVNHQAAGSVELANPLQYEVFQAIQGGRYHGAVDYTNFTYPESGSGVYAPVAGPDALVFTFGGAQFAHTLNGGSLRLAALSNNVLAFSGTGAYSGGQAWTISGQVAGNRLTATIVYTGTKPLYKVNMTGRIAPNGSAAGTARSNTGQALTWTMPAGFRSVLSYVAPISSASVKGRDASFTFTVPARAGLGSVKVTVTVHDGGPGARHDSYAQNGTGYAIIGGPGITVR